MYTIYLHQQNSICIDILKGNLLPNKSKLQNVKSGVIPNEYVITIQEIPINNQI